jgi:putative Ig domain-containing protein
MSAKGLTAGRGVLSRWAVPAALIVAAAGLGSLVAPQAAHASSLAFTSASSDTEMYGSPFSFTVTTSGSPAPRLTKSGLLPVGVKFTDNADGTATLAGTPRGRSEGVYPLTFYANGRGFARQSFTLTIERVPSLRHEGTVRTEVGVAVDHVLSGEGYPEITLSLSGALPTGLTFTDNGDETASISGTPAPGTGGDYPVTVTAANSLGTASESFTVKVAEPPAFTSADSASATEGSPFSFTATASGFGAPSITESGALPHGVAFHAAAATFSGTPAAGTAGSYPVTLTAKNHYGVVTQTFTLTVSS